MNGLTKMLYSPQMDKILAELEDYQGTTLGDLLELHAGLQPAVRSEQLVPPAADLPEALSDARRAGQRSRRVGVLRRCYCRDGRVDDVEGVGTKVIDGLKSAAVDFFHDIKW